MSERLNDSQTATETDREGGRYQLQRRGRATACVFPSTSLELASFILNPLMNLQIAQSFTRRARNTQEGKDVRTHKSTYNKKEASQAKD